MRSKTTKNPRSFCYVYPSVHLRQERSKKPRCRPTPGACKGYKKPKNEDLYMNLEEIVREELEKVISKKLAGAVWIYFSENS